MAAFLSAAQENQDQLYENAEQFNLHPVIADKLIILQRLHQMYEAFKGAAERRDGDDRVILEDKVNEIGDLVSRVKGLYVYKGDITYQEYEERDNYLSTISDESLEVLQHFGEEAPHLLNQYSCAVEDALIEQVKRNQELQTELAALKGESAPEPAESEELKQAKAQLEKALRK